MVTAAPGTGTPERLARAAVRPWHELDYELLVADSDRILADALTPQTVVLLATMATARSGPRHRPRPRWSGWPVTAPPAPQIRATQRSPPGGSEPTGGWPGCDSNTRGETPGSTDETGTARERSRKE
ncbi:hypothetical protein P3H15_51310 [Rhodococcus sp. T2V]|nr:hypothetical protein [Rhodococcus sp. T2V]MDF3313310.1 hypothetical protein [Rhodococcus sp. T2V]